MRGPYLDNIDVLSGRGIMHRLLYLSRKTLLRVGMLDEVGSTNDYLRNFYKAFHLPGNIGLVAGKQTAGRGQADHRFYSPPDAGLYMSLLVHPKQMTPEEAKKLTPYCALLVCQCLEDRFGLDIGIKWVNDLYKGDRKVGGILCESGVNQEGLLDWLIIGLGLNFYHPLGGYPPELEKVAGYLFDAPVSEARNELAATFLERFLQTYEQLPEGWQAQYRDRVRIIGETIRFNWPVGGRREMARCVDIDDQCRLVLRFQSGKTQAFEYGEVTLAQ